MRFDSPLADRLTALVLFVVGAAMLYGGYVMDRLEVRQIHPASIPGLVPMILGGALMLCSVLLFLSVRASAEPIRTDRHSWTNLLIAAVWSGFFALGLVGTVPFVAAVAIYVAGFILYFGWPHQDDMRDKAKLAAFAVVFAIVVAVGVSALFRYGFLVRLP